MSGVLTVRTQAPLTPQAGSTRADRLLRSVPVYPLRCPCACRPSWPPTQLRPWPRWSSGTPAPAPGALVRTGGGSGDVFPRTSAWAGGSAGLEVRGQAPCLPSQAARSWVRSKTFLKLLFYQQCGCHSGELSEVENVPVLYRQACSAVSLLAALPPLPSIRG